MKLTYFLSHKSLLWNCLSLDCLFMGKGGRVGACPPPEKYQETFFLYERPFAILFSSWGTFSPCGVPFWACPPPPSLQKFLRAPVCLLTICIWISCLCFIIICHSSCIYYYHTGIVAFSLCVWWDWHGIGVGR